MGGIPPPLLPIFLIPEIFQLEGLKMFFVYQIILEICQKGLKMDQKGLNRWKGLKILELEVIPTPLIAPFPFPTSVILTVKLARLDISSDAILVSFLSCLRIKAFKRKESFTSGHHHFQFSITLIEDDRCRSGKGRRLERCRPTCLFSPGRFVAPRRQPCWQNQKKTTLNTGNILFTFHSQIFDS